MKKILGFSLITISLFFTFLSANADDFLSLLSQKKPYAVLIYADWADNKESALQAFDNIQGTFENRYNFSSINIASQDAKAFNQKYYIYTNLPYVMLFKENGRISRWIGRDCLIDSSCMKDQLELFAN